MRKGISMPIDISVIVVIAIIVTVILIGFLMFGAREPIGEQEKRMVLTSCCVGHVSKICWAKEASELSSVQCFVSENLREYFSTTTETQSLENVLKKLGIVSLNQPIDNSNLPDIKKACNCFVS